MELFRIIDKTSVFVRDDFTWNEETEIGLDVEPAQGLYQPKWDGLQWIENASQEYIDSLKSAIQSVTEAQVIEDLIALLVESGVITGV